MVEFIIGASGTGKTTAMFRRIEKFQKDGMKVCSVVPEQFSNDFDKKLYFYIGAKNFNNLLSLTFNSISRQIFQIYGDPNRDGKYADEMSRMILIYKAVSAARANPESLKFFEKRSVQTGFAEEMLKLITDMKHSGITPQTLFEKAEVFENKLCDKTTDIASIYYEYEKIMEECGFKDNLENIIEAAKIANAQEFFKGKCVCFDEFESFNADQLEMIKIIFATAENVVITLRTDDVNSGAFTLFETVNSTYMKLMEICRDMNLKCRLVRCNKSFRFRSSDLEYLSKRIMRNLPYEPEKAPAPHNINIFESKDMYGEVEYVCAEIKRLVHFSKPLKYKDIAIISNNIEQYANILKAAFERYDIPYFLSIERSINHTAIIVFFSALLDLLTARKIHSEQIFRILKCGILEESLTDISLLENYCYKWNIDGDIWLGEFNAEDENIELIESIRERIITPIIELKKKLKGKIKSETACQLLYDYMTECNAERSVARIMNELIRSNRDHDASELKRIWSCLINILDSIVSTIGNCEMSFSEIANIMRSMIGRIKYSVPPQTLDSVMTASARTARLDEPKIIFVIGATDGDFPNQVNIYGLFSEGDKQKLSVQGIEISRSLSDLVASERLIVYKSLSIASDRLYVTYPLSDLSGQAKYPAPVIEQIQKMFNEKIIITEKDLLPHFYAVTLNSAYYHYMQKRAENSVSIASIEKALLSDESYSSRVASVLSRSVSRSEYSVKSKTIEKLKGMKPFRLSPTGIENYNKCHFMYFCNDCLKLKAPEKIDIDVRIAGDLTHSCFCSVLQSKKKADFVNLTYDEIREEINEQAENYRNEKLGGDFSKTPRFELIFNKLKEQLVEVFVHTQESLMESDFKPDAFEIGVNNKNVLKFEKSNGEWISFYGVIDRADTFEIDGKKYLRIVDYKSSKKVINVYNLANGINLQMLLYLFMATENSGDYKNYTPAGVLYAPIRISEISTEETKNSSKNQSVIDSELKTTGLLIDDIDILNAMEHDVKGRFIPAKRNKDGTCSKKSSVISSENMEKLRAFIYNSVVSMAESVCNGKIEAVPLVKGQEKPCNFCKFSAICGNGEGRICHGTDKEKEKEVCEILGKDIKGEDTE